MVISHLALTRGVAAARHTVLRVAVHDENTPADLINIGNADLHDVLWRAVVPMSKSLNKRSRSLV